MLSPSVADILRDHIASYSQSCGLSAKQWKVINAIMNCRTAALGGHLYHCGCCGRDRPCYNPCRDRHCPNCQYVLKEQWVRRRLKELLPVPYYHVVFTLPHSLNDLISFNRTLLYNLFFRCVQQTMRAFAADRKYLGAQCGYLALLHTWGQKLGQHVHLHLIVAGGGITDTGEWKSVPYQERFLFPVRAVGKMFRGKFIDKLKKLHHKGKLNIPQSLEMYQQLHVFEHFLDAIAHKKWRVYCKRPFADAQRVLRYIGRYTHRVAITNRRLIEYSGKKVRFSYKDYKGRSQGEDLNKEIVLSVDTFIKRFLLHVLPRGFNKIRFYGFWAGRVKKELIKRLQQAMAEQQPEESEDDEQQENANLCPQCKVMMFYKALLEPVYGQVNFLNTS
jgi:hypothetical protein